MGHWWSRVRRVHQVAFPRGARDVDEPTPTRRPYRRADWPVCPQCEEDELVTTLIDIDHPPHPSDPMRCLSCGWRGVVLQRETDQS